MWFLLTKITTSDIIGISSTLISLSVIFSQIVDLHVGVGSTLFLGKSFSDGRIGHAKLIVKASLLIVSIGILAGCGFIIVFKQWLLPAISYELIMILTLLIGTSVLFNFFRSVIIASLKTKSLPTITLISSVLRIFLVVLLIFLGMGSVGITLGYLAGFTLSFVLLAVILARDLATVKKQTKQNTIELYRTCKSILVASVPSWIPTVLAVIGSHLGTVLIFGINGPSQAAFFFISISIFLAIDAIRNSLFSVAFPMLSAMDDRRKRLMWRLMKMSLVVSIPISTAVMLYSGQVLGILGIDYIQGSTSLKVILLSVFPLTLLFGISTLVYSYANYRHVFTIGIGLNAPRILLYFILVPVYGSVGAAMAFTMGSIIGFGISIIIAKKIGMIILWKQLGLIVAIPTALALVLFYSQITYMIGIPFILALSVLLMFVLRALSKSEVVDSLEILPESIGKPLINIINKLYITSKDEK